MDGYGTKGQVWQIVVTDAAGATATLDDAVVEGTRGVGAAGATVLIAAERLGREAEVIGSQASQPNGSASRAPAA